MTTEIKFPFNSQNLTQAKTQVSVNPIVNIAFKSSGVLNAQDEQLKNRVHDLLCRTVKDWALKEPTGISAISANSAKKSSSDLLRQRPAGARAPTAGYDFFSSALMRGEFVEHRHAKELPGVTSPVRPASTEIASHPHLSPITLSTPDNWTREPAKSSKIEQAVCAE